MPATDEEDGDEGGDMGGGEGAVRRTGRQATDTRHITMALLEEGGYFDMPLKVRARLRCSQAEPAQP